MPLTTHHVDAALGRWTHTEWRPAPGHPLAGLVERLWHFAGQTTFPRERGFPHGALELIVHLGPRFRGVEPHGLVDYPQACAVGLQTGASVIEAPPGAVCVLGVRLYPAGAYAVLGAPPAELTDATVDLDAVTDHAAGALASRCHDARGAEARLRLAAAWVAERVGRAEAAGRLADPAVAWAAARLAATHGAEPIARLQARAGYPLAGERRGRASPRGSARRWGSRPSATRACCASAARSRCCTKPRAARRRAGAVAGRRRARGRLLRPAAPHRRLPRVRRDDAGRADGRGALPQRAEPGRAGVSRGGPRRAAPNLQDAASAGG